MSRKLKKLTHQYEFLKLELEEIQDELVEYDKEWAKLFGKHFMDKNTEMWVNEETGEMRNEKPTDAEMSKKTKPPPPEKVKHLYRKLSTFTHPDKGGDPDDFNKVKEFYEKNNLLELLKFASKYDLKYQLEEEDEEILIKSCDNLRTHIRNRKNTMAWLYFTGNKNKKLGVIKMLEAYLGKKIDREDYPAELLEN